MLIQYLLCTLGQEEEAAYSWRQTAGASEQLPQGLRAVDISAETKLAA